MEVNDKYSGNENQQDSSPEWRGPVGDRSGYLRVFYPIVTGIGQHHSTSIGATRFRTPEFENPKVFA